MSGEESLEAAISDSKVKARFKTLKSEVGSILASFKRAEDWADLIRDLQRLGRLLQKFQDVPFLPHKLEIGRRLAQCLSISLPSGVHLKALEVYDIILSRFHSALTLGDMHLFGLGILPLYAVASTTIRPSILQLYEKYFVNLPEDFIVSLLQGLLASILPGMDEASGEFYVRLTSLFDIIRSRLSHQDSFFQILWRTISDFPPCRLNALNYLLSKSGQLSISDSWTPFMKPAILLCLEDGHILVVRAILDFLCSSIPISSVESIFQDDSVTLVQKVLQCLLLKDASITKRVFVWILEERDDLTTTTTTAIASVDKDDSLELLIAALKEFLVHIPPSVNDCSWNPLIIIHTLFERPSLQDMLKDKIALELLEYGFTCLEMLHLNRKSGESSSTNAVNSKVSVDFNQGLDDSTNSTTKLYSSHEMERLFVELLSGSCYIPLFKQMEDLLASKVENLSSLRWRAFSYVLELPTSNNNNNDQQKLPVDYRTGWCIRVMQHTLKFIRELNNLKGFWVWKNHKPVWDFFYRTLFMYLSRVEGELSQGKYWSDFQSIAKDFMDSMKKWMTNIILTDNSSCLSSSKRDWMIEELGGEDAALFEKFLLQIGFTFRLFCSSLQSKEMCEEMWHLAQRQSLSSHFIVAYCGVVQFVELFAILVNEEKQTSARFSTRPSSLADATSETDDREATILSVLSYWWSLLHPSSENSCVRVAQVWFSLQKCFPILAQRMICKQLNSRSNIERLENLECFAMLWKYVWSCSWSNTPPAICTLDAIDLLNDPDESIKSCAANWILDCFYYQPSSILDILIGCILESNFYWETSCSSIVNIEDAPRARYGLQQLNKVISTICSYRYVLLERDSLVFTRLQSSSFIAGRLSQVFVTSHTDRRTATVFSEEQQQQEEEESSARDVQLNNNMDKDKNWKTFPTALFPPSEYYHVMAVVALCFLQSDLQSILSQRWERQRQWDARDLLPCMEDLSLLKYQNEQEWMTVFIGSEDPSFFFSSLYYNAANVLWNVLQLVQPVYLSGKELSWNMYTFVWIALEKAIDRRDEPLQCILLQVLERIMLYQGPIWGIPESIHFQQLHADATTSHLTNNVPVEDSTTSSNSSHRRIMMMERCPLFQSGYIRGIRQSFSNIRGKNGLVLARKWIQFTEDILYVTQYALPFIVETFLTIVGEQLERLFSMDHPPCPAVAEEAISEQLVLYTSGMYSVLKRVFQIHRQAVKNGILSSSSENVASWKYSMASQSNAASSNNSENDNPSQSNMSSPIVRVATLNPFRLLNDWVKDVWGKESMEQTDKNRIDPRQEAIRRLVLNSLDNLIAWLVDSWWRPRSHVVVGEEDEMTGRPKPFSHRTWCIYLVDLLFRKHPVDTLAAITVFWEQRILQSSSFHSSQQQEASNCYPCAEVLFELLHATDIATPSMVLSSCAELAAAATFVYGTQETKGWDSEDSNNPSMEDELESWILSIVPPKLDKTSLSVVRLSSLVAPGSTPTLFCANEWFRQHSIQRSMISFLSFMEWYISSCAEPGENSSDLLTAWPYISSCLRDVLNICTTDKRPIAFFIALRLMAAFFIRAIHPLVDRSIQRDWTELFMYLVNHCCCPIAGGCIQQRDAKNPVKNMECYPESAAQVVSRAYSILSITIAPVFVWISSSNHNQHIYPSSRMTNNNNNNYSNRRMKIGDNDMEMWTTSIGIPVVQQIVNVAVTTIRRIGNHSSSSEDSYELECAVEAVKLLNSCCCFPWAARVMRKEVMSLLESNNIFRHKNEMFLGEFARLIRELLSSSVGGVSFSETSASPHATDISTTNSHHPWMQHWPGFMTTSNFLVGTSANSYSTSVTNNNNNNNNTSSSSNNPMSNVWLKTTRQEDSTCRVLRRISFCFYAGAKNQWIAQLPWLLERWNEAVVEEIGDTTSRVHKECLFGMRILLIRYSAPHISLFRVWLQMELFQIFTRFPPTNYAELWIEALTTIDYLLLLGMSEFIYTKNFFFSDAVNDDKKKKKNRDRDVPVISNWLHNIPQWEEQVKPFQAIIQYQLEQGLPIHPEDTSSLLHDRKPQQQQQYLIALAAGIEKRATQPIWRTIPPCLQAVEEAIQREFLD